MSNARSDGEPDHECEACPGGHECPNVCHVCARAVEDERDRLAAKLKLAEEHIADLEYALGLENKP